MNDPQVQIKAMIKENKIKNFLNIRKEDRNFKGDKILMKFLINWIRKFLQQNN